MIFDRKKVMLHIQKLVKSYQDLKAVKGVDLEVPKGELFGFLGPNGAGKTTTIKMIVGLLKPTSGTVSIGGFDIGTQSTEAKSILGYIPDRPFIYEKLTGREYLAFIADLYNMDAADAAERTQKYLDFFDLTEAGDKLVEGYSHGMKQKLIISGALLHDPKLVVVDEPMVGLDPKGARQVKQLFRDLCREGTSVFLCPPIPSASHRRCATGSASSKRARSSRWGPWTNCGSRWTGTMSIWKIFSWS